jgi:hypothetical protein
MWGCREPVDRALQSPHFRIMSEEPEQQYVVFDALLVLYPLQCDQQRKDLPLPCLRESSRETRQN